MTYLIFKIPLNPGFEVFTKCLIPTSTSRPSEGVVLFLAPRASIAGVASPILDSSVTACRTELPLTCEGDREIFCLFEGRGDSVVFGASGFMVSTPWFGFFTLAILGRSLFPFIQCG